MRSDLGIDEQRNLRHADAQQGRGHQTHNILGTGILPTAAQFGPTPSQARHHTNPAQSRYLHRQLQHAAGHHAHCHRENRLNPTRLQLRSQAPGSRDGAQIEQDRRGRRHRKAPVGIEHAGGQSHQRHATDVGEHEAGHEHGRVIAARILLQATGHGPHHQRRGHHAHCTDQQQHPDHDAGDFVHQRLGRLMPVARMGCRQHRDKSLAECAFSEHTPEQIRNAKRHIEGVRHGTGTKSCCQQSLPYQTGHAREQRP